MRKLMRALAVSDLDPFIALLQGLQEIGIRAFHAADYPMRCWIERIA